MVEARELFPRLGGVAGFATAGCSLGAILLHAFCELPLVRVFVAGYAGKILPVIEDDRLGCSILGQAFLGRAFSVGLLFVAIAAGNGYVSASE